VIPRVHWFAIWTRSRHEQVVREQLERKQIETFPPDGHPLEPLEGSQEEDRLAAVSRLLLRAVRPADGCRSQVHRVVNISLVRRRARADPDHEILGIRQLVESDWHFDPCPMIREGMMVEVVHGRLRASSDACCARSARAPGAVGGSDRAGGQRRGRRGRRAAHTESEPEASRFSDLETRMKIGIVLVDPVASRQWRHDGHRASAASSSATAGAGSS
jgi:hypothetical protein